MSSAAEALPSASEHMPSVICGAAPNFSADYDHSDWLIQPQAVCERSLIINREHAELDETDVVTFQDETCQLAGGKGTGIDVDAISADVRFNHGRVAVDNRFFVSAFMH